MMENTLAFSFPGPWEILVVLIIIGIFASFVFLAAKYFKSKP
jgi:hypothetical protein